jgi:hypothetical protein
MILSTTIRFRHQMPHRVRRDLVASPGVGRRQDVGPPLGNLLRRQSDFAEVHSIFSDAPISEPLVEFRSPVAAVLLRTEDRDISVVGRSFQDIRMA